jgi:hypothetical protein
VDKSEIKSNLYQFFSILILFVLAFSFHVSAQDGDCDDKNPCTLDTYDLDKGCVHTSISCDDDNPCTADSCGEMGCVHSPICCDDGSPCTTDSCDETGCVNTPMNCDDGNPCTTDSCRGTDCVHFATSCDDGNPCTVDSCSETGCVHIPKSCDDGNPCTDDACNSSTGCIHSPKICDDSRPCTTDSCDPVKGCINTTKNCDDGNSCTDDSCDGKGNCVHTPKNCDDGNACTIDLCKGKGHCSHMFRICDVGNPCTLDSCDSVWGCLHTPVICDGGRTCIDGVCQYSPNSYAAYPGSSVIPPGTILPLPWGSEVTALNVLRAENGVFSAYESPMKFTRQLGYQATPSSLNSIATSEKAEMIGLTWQGSPLTMTLTKPDGSILYPDGTSPDVVRVKGSNYEYYFLKNPAIGNWNIGVQPSNQMASSERFTLITGLVNGAIPTNPPQT